MHMGRGHEGSSCEGLVTKTIWRGSRQARWAALIAGALALTGAACNSTAIVTKSSTDSTDTTQTTPPGTCLYADCPVETCTTTVVIRRDMLEGCYGWDGSSWATTAPGFVKDCDGSHANCTCDSNGLCSFSFSSDVHPKAQCSVGSVNDAVSGSFCGYEGADTTQVDQIAEQVTEDCRLDFSLQPLPPDCPAPDTSHVKLGSNACNSCDSRVAARASQPPVGGLTLSLDPARSFLALTTPVQSVMVRLSGDASVDLPGNRLLGLKMSADPVRFAASDWNGFTFSLEQPVPLTRSGEAFRIPVAERPTIIGIGRRDGLPTRLRASSATDVTGHLSVAQKTWDLDLADQNMAGSFTLHLVGRISP